jgi:tetratricopeptide (TPR) repeat protein
MVLRQWKKRPWLLTGWLWYLGMLVPVTGLFMQAGSQAHADRYTYLPQAGLILMLTWMAADLLSGRRFGRAVLSLAAALCLAALTATAYVQAGIWRNSGTLWIHTLSHAPDNTVALTNLSEWLLEEGRPAEAQRCLDRTLLIKPNDLVSLSLRGNAAFAQGRLEEAAAFYERIIELEPAFFLPHRNLGLVFLQSGQPVRAADCFRTVLKLQPDDEEVKNLFLQAVKDMPPQSDPADAIVLYRQALKLKPDFISALNNLAWLLATCPDAAFRNGTEAVDLAERAVRLTGGNNPAFLDTLAAAYAEAGRFAEAVATAERAVELARAQPDETQAQKLDARLELYRQGRPFRQ